MRTPEPLPSHLRGRPFTVSDAREAGASAERLRRRDLAGPYRGVRVPASWPRDLASRCRAYSARMPAQHAFSHSTAACLHGLPVPRRLLTPDLHVLTPAPHRAPRCRGVVGHQAESGAVTVQIVNGVRAVSAVDAWCQLSTELNVRELVVVGDALVRRRRPIATMEQLREAVARHRGRRGCRRLVRALELVRPRTDSPKETELRLDIVAFGLPEPAVNVPIRNADGHVFAYGDLTYEEYRVIAEYDGEQHRLDDDQFASDGDRLAALDNLRWEVVRFTKRHQGARRLDKLRLLRTKLLEAGWRPPPAAPPADRGRRGGRRRRKAPR